MNATNFRYIERGKSCYRACAAVPHFPKIVHSARMPLVAAFRYFMEYEFDDSSVSEKLELLIQ